MLTFILLCAYTALLALLWGWAIYHAFTTPRTPFSRRGLWSATLLINPLASMWYWYVWKRWAFWSLFIPTLVFSAFLPQALQEVLQTLSARDLADRFVSVMNVILTNAIDVIPLFIAIPLFAFPFIMRLAALAHLGGNHKLEAGDRNDQSITFSIPFFGYGAALSYCFQWRRGWALAGLIWFVFASSVTWSLLRYI